MLNIKNPENLILIYILFIMAIVGINIILSFDILDVAYFVVLFGCLIWFLIIKFK